MVRIRLARGGSKKRPFYRVVVADSRSPRDGRFIERIGHYNQFSSNPDDLLKFDVERYLHWVEKGAQPSDKVKYLLKLSKKQNSGDA